MSAPPAPAPFILEPSGTQSMQAFVPMPLGAIDVERRMLPESSPGVSLVGKLPPALSHRFEDWSDQLFMMLGSTFIPMPGLPVDRRFFAAMLQPSGLALQGAPSLRSWSPTTPASTTVLNTDTLSTFVSAAPRENTPTFCALMKTLSFTRLWPSGSTRPLNFRARIVEPCFAFSAIAPRILVRDP